MAAARSCSSRTTRRCARRSPATCGRTVTRSSRHRRRPARALLEPGPAVGRGPRHQPARRNRLVAPSRSTPPGRGRRSAGRDRERDDGQPAPTRGVRCRGLSPQAVPARDALSTLERCWLGGTRSMTDCRSREPAASFFAGYSCVRPGGVTSHLSVLAALLRLPVWALWPEVQPTDLLTLVVLAAAVLHRHADRRDLHRQGHGGRADPAEPGPRPDRARDLPRLRHRRERRAGLEGLCGLGPRPGARRDRRPVHHAPAPGRPAAQPGGNGAQSPDLAFNTAVSFETNTNWQNYSGETGATYLTQAVRSRGPELHLRR